MRLRLLIYPIISVINFGLLVTIYSYFGLFAAVAFLVALALLGRLAYAIGTRRWLRRAHTERDVYEAQRKEKEEAKLRAEYFEAQLKDL